MEGGVLLLTNPKFAVKRKRSPPPQFTPRDRNERPQSAPRRPPPGTRGAPPGAPGPRGAQDDDDSSAAAAAPGDGGKDGRRRKEVGGKREFGKKDETRDGAPARKGIRERRTRRGGFDDEVEGVTTRSAPRSKKRGGRARGPPPPPVVPTGPVQVRLGETITVGELADALNVGVAEVVKDLMKKGVLASITQSIDAETAEAIALGFGAEVTRGDQGDAANAADEDWGVVDGEDEENLVSRPPVVTVMGHVDHGKTSLLDALRSTDTVAGEAGGITQHIGASAVTAPNGQTITFIDTPGHAAFSEMRSRGANVTDIVVLVVAADDGVKEQTISSINAAKAANVPVVVAINKIDKPNNDPSRVKTQLLEHEIVLEEFGGDVLSALVSAKERTNLDGLLEQLQLQADLLDLKSNPDRLAAGTVVEARQVVGLGAVATALVQKGTLRVGDVIVAGAQWGRVRRLSDARGDMEAAGPSTAVEIVGLNGMPAAGDAFTATPDESKARQIAEVRQQLQRERRTASLFSARSTQDRESFLSGRKDGELPVHLIDLVIKSDVQGSAEALCSSLEELEVSDDKLRVKTRVLRSGAGAITSEDVMLASVSNALVLGFNSQAARPTMDEAERSNVKIQEYSIVYDLLDDIKAHMATFIRPPPAKHLGALVGSADVLQTFKIGAIGKVAGCKVFDGYVPTGCNVRILRGNSIEYEGKLASLRSVKDEVEQIDAVTECGMAFEDYQVMEPGDRVEAYVMSE